MVSCQLNDQGIQGHIHDIRAENIGDGYNVLTVRSICPYLDEYQLTLHAVPFLQSLDICHIHKLRQLLCDLIQDLPVSLDHYSHTGISGIRRLSDSQTVNIIASPAEKTSDPAQYAGGIVHEQG